MIGEQIGNFKLISVLGQGGMGEVWLGEHAAIGTKVAIKMLLPHISANKEHVERFFNEAIAVGKIAHAGIVKIFDVGFHNGRAYLVMEYMAGESLAARIRRLGRLPLAMTSEIGRQISGVLEAVHKAGITHRDLKPDNIFLVPDDELASGERVKVLDFGIAKLSGAGGGLTATASGSMGTPAYMSPEQWKNSKNVDWRADAYSLGCLAFEMASGGPPFPAETIGEACAKHLTEDPPRLASQVAVPAPLDQLVARLLEKSPDARPASMREIATLFGALATVNPIGLATTQLSGHVAVPQVSAQLPAASSSVVPRDARTLPSGVLDRLPPESMTPPPMHPVTTLGGAVASAQVAPPKKSSALMWILIGAGGVFAVGVVLLATMLGGGGGKKHRDDKEAIAEPPRPPEPVTPMPAPIVAPTPIPEPPPPPPKEEPKPVGVGSALPKTTEPPPARKPPAQPTAPAPPKGCPTCGADETCVVDKCVKRSTSVASGPCDMDEVACLLAEKPPACCAKFKKPKPPPSGGTDLPTLDRAAISAGVASVKGRIAACGDKFPARGTVKLAVHVSPDGTVASVTVKETPGPGLGNCAARAMGQARFQRTQSGGTFSYPFVF